MATLELLLLLIAAALALTVVARWLQIPSAVMLVLGGMVLAFVPGLPPLRLDPDLALALFLPPLLQASALRTDWNLFRSNILFIVLLAFGAVLFTTFVVAIAARSLIPGFGWPAAVALGAIVAPPDAVAATSVLKRFRLPKRIVAVLEGESLVNDASALVIYRLAIGAGAAGALGFDHVAGAFALIAVVGVIVGMAAGVIANWLMLRLQDRFLEILVSFLAAFISYLGAERIGGSGVLAAVACGGLIGRAQLKLTAQTRLQAHSAWELVEFILASLVFLIVGLQLREIAADLTEYRPDQLLLLGGVIAGVLIVARFVWVFATFYPAAAIIAALRGGGFSPSPSYPAIISWAGMRGVVSLAAALALPAAFPRRDIIVFLAFGAIFVTLVLQGTTLKFLIRWFDPRDPEVEAVTEAAIAARAKVAAAVAGVTGPNDIAGAVDSFHAEQRVVAATGTLPPTLVAKLEQKLEAIAAARAELADRRDEMDGETMMTLVRELDLEEEQVRLALDRANDAADV